MSQKEFAVGDEVTWTSQAQGYEREKPEQLSPY